jgi:hypothetical protein
MSLANAYAFDVAAAIMGNLGYILGLAGMLYLSHLQMKMATFRHSIDADIAKLTHGHLTHVMDAYRHSSNDQIRLAGILFRAGRTLERLGHPDEAAALFAEVAAKPAEQPAEVQPCPTV